MDYMERFCPTDLTEAANIHTKEMKDDYPYYYIVYDPETSVIALLNLIDDEKYVKPVFKKMLDELDCIVTVVFVKENKAVDVYMRRREPNGPWMPQLIVDSADIV